MIRFPKLTHHGLTVQIFIGLTLGATLGLLLNASGLNQHSFVVDWLINGILHIGGQAFLRSLQMLVVPIVFISLVCGTAGLGDLKKLGRIGGKTFGLYMITTAIAISFGLLIALLISPGMGFDLVSDASFVAQAPPSLVETFINLIPKNPLEAMAQGEMLQIIFFAGLFGVALTISGEPGKRVLSVFEDFNIVVLKLTGIVIRFSPLGVFCLIGKVFAEQGFDAIAPLARYFFTILFVLMVHLILVYPILLKVFTGLSPITFIKKFNEVMFFAFSTASSNATIPVCMETVEKRLGVNKSVCSFTIPLGATINMDGTAIMQGVATVFVSQAYGIELGFSQYMMVILTATLASIGTAGVPGVGLIMLAMVFQQVGLPLEGIGIIMAVDRLLDMVRTSVNVAGDATVSCIVAHSEKQLDHAVYNCPTVKQTL
jgi:Na+/H+-dicarboxylate symporter